MTQRTVSACSKHRRTAPRGVDGSGLVTEQRSHDVSAETREPRRLSGRWRRAPRAVAPRTGNDESEGGNPLRLASPLRCPAPGKGFAQNTRPESACRSAGRGRPVKFQTEIRAFSSPGTALYNGSVMRTGAPTSQRYGRARERLARPSLGVASWPAAYLSRYSSSEIDRWPKRTTLPLLGKVVAMLPMRLPRLASQQSP